MLYVLIKQEYIYSYTKKLYHNHCYILVCTYLQVSLASVNCSVILYLDFGLKTQNYINIIFFYICCLLINITFKMYNNNNNNNNNLLVES